MRTEYGGASLGAQGGWAVVNAHPHRERIALENLKRQSFHAYCPLIRRSVSHGRRVHEALRPLFPGYLFVRIDPSSRRWRAMVSTYGVRALVRCGDRLSLIEDGFVQSLKAREVDGVIVRPPSPYRVGQKVRVAGGAFDGLAATVIAMHEKDRLTVLMELLRRRVKVTLEERLVSPV